MSTSQERQPTLDSVAPRFLVADMEQALAFYGQLGFVTPYHDEGFAIIERDGIALHFNVSDPTEEPPRGSPGGLDWRHQYRDIVSAVFADRCYSVSSPGSALGNERIFPLRSFSQSPDFWGKDSCDIISTRSTNAHFNGSSFSCRRYGASAGLLCSTWLCDHHS